MKMTMKRTRSGAANQNGSKAMSYMAGQIYDMVEDWQIALAEAWERQGFCDLTEGSDNPDLETKIVPVDEVKAEPEPKPEPEPADPPEGDTEPELDETGEADSSDTDQ